MSADQEHPIWGKINHRLVGLLQQQRRAVYQSKNEFSPNAWDIPQAHCSAIRNQADRLFKIYCETWKASGEIISPEFLRTVHLKGIIPFLQRSSRDFHRGLNKSDWEWLRRLAEPPLTGHAFDKKWAVTHFSREFRQLMCTLRKDRTLRIEIEAEQLEHVGSRSQPRFKPLSKDYRKILFAGRQYDIAATPAAIIKYLHQVWLEDERRLALNSRCQIGD
jgi:hypothetical protein